MPLTSPVPPLDLPVLFPGVEAFARTATRLHPRPGRPTPSDSHIGGMLLWPASEPWPVCGGPHIVPTRTPVPPEFAAALQRPSPEVMMALAGQIPGFIGVETTATGTFLMGEETGWEPAPVPMLPVAQLHAADVPDLRCPAGTDLLQVLWCPTHHPGPESRRVLVRWRAASRVAEPLAESPAAGHDSEWAPRPCVLHPEQVTEYPWWQELPGPLGRRVRAFDDERTFGEDSYFSVAQAPGWKVGGHATWEVSDLQPMDCPQCATAMDLLLTIDATEYRGGDAWLPVEEAHLQPGSQDRRDADDPTGIPLGRLRIFVCRSCPDTPIRVNPQ